MKTGKLMGRTAVAMLSVGFFLTFAVSMMAQVQSETTTTTGPSTREVNVQRGEVVYVSGNDLIVKAENGQIIHFANVPESARVTVDGRQLGIHDLKVGMKLERTITTTTTPQLVTKVERVSGTVFHVNPPNSVILRLDNGTNHMYKIPHGQKFNIDGQEVDAWGLKEGMRITATRVTETPETRVAVERHVSGQMPPPPPPAHVPILVAIIRPAPAPAVQEQENEVAEAEPAALPATGSNLPEIGLLGIVLLSLGFGLRKIRNAH